MKYEGVTGLEVCERNIAKVKKKYAEQGAKALEAWGRDTINDSKDNYCPIDTGEMVGTGNLQMDRGATRIEVTLYYNTFYAATVHENPRPYHPIGQAGFLRIPFNNHAPQLLTTVAGYLKKVSL
ncbi:MAG: hypothetical protein WC248_00900 [Candidatus Methanomethylophilaceae archaeon]|jgi:hypothetical protein